MSMRSWTVDGYGINAGILVCPVELKEAFIKKYLPKVYEEMANDCQNEDTEEYMLNVDDWINNYEDFNCRYGFEALFAEAINENEDGFDVDYYDGEYEEAIAYEDRAPWEMSDRVKQMKNREDMKAIFAKYLNELDIKEFAFERQSVEFWG